MTQKEARCVAAEPSETQRLDKWLWYTRIVKSRTLAAGMIERGKVRVNRARVIKASFTIKPGDVITATVAKKVRILKVLAAGHRRGPATEAQGLYEDLTPAAIPRTPAVLKSGIDNTVAQGTRAITREPGAGRPTKRDRRQIDRLKSRYENN